MSRILGWLDALLKRSLVNRGKRAPAPSLRRRPVLLAASAGLVLGAFIMLAHGHGLGEEDGAMHLQMYAFYCLPPAVILGAAAALLQRTDRGKSA